MAESSMLANTAVSQLSAFGRYAIVRGPYN